MFVLFNTILNPDCDSSLFNLPPSLGDNTVCHMSSSCTRVDCCFYSPILDMSFNAFFDLNVCDYYIQVTFVTVFIQWLPYRLIKMKQIKCFFQCFTSNKYDSLRRYDIIVVRKDVSIIIVIWEALIVKCSNAPSSSSSSSAISWLEVTRAGHTLWSLCVHSV